jgi:hypothetical protein
MSLSAKPLNALAGIARRLHPAPHLEPAAGAVDTLPAFRADGALPAGIHRAGVDEFLTRFATTPRRSRMADHLVAELHRRGDDRAWIAGSFITSKGRPGDVDVVVQVDAMPYFADTVDAEAARRGINIYSHEPGQAVTNDVGSWPDMLDFFRHGRDGAERGVVELVLKP